MTAKKRAKHQHKNAAAPSPANSSPQTAQNACAAADSIPGQDNYAQSPQAAAQEEPLVAESLLHKAERERDEYLALAQRERAELENYRKRVEREREQLKRASLGAFLREFLKPFDELDRAITEGEKNKAFDSYHDGVKLVRENLWKVLSGAGLKKIEAIGEKFDPVMHEAMTAIPSSAHAPNTVMDVFEQGYMLDDFVLRPSRVIVSAAPPQQNDNQEE